MTYRSNPLRDELSAILAQKANAYVDLDPRVAGVSIPAHLRAQASVTLEYGENMAIPIPDLSVTDAGIAATLSFNRTPTPTFVPWSAVRSVRPSPNVTQPTQATQYFCTLCRRERAQVEHLLQGEAGSVCSDCVVQAVAVLAGQRRGGPVAMLGWVTESVLAELDPKTPGATSAPGLRAAIALAGADPEAVYRVIRRARELHQPELVLEATAALTPSAMTFRHRTERFVALQELHRPAEARAELEAIDRRALDSHDRVVDFVNRAAVRVALGGSELDGVEPDLQAAELLISELSGKPGHAGVTDLRKPIAVTRARLNLARGRLDHALRAISPLHDAEDAEALLVAGDVVRATRGQEHAVPIYLKALDLAHPESHVAAELRERVRPAG